MGERELRGLGREIMQKANVGLWAYEKEDDKPVRMFADECMIKLMGAPENLSPEELFDFWYERIADEYREDIGDIFNKMLLGKHVEIQYVWKHPDGEPRIIRCGGARVESRGSLVRCEGSHQDITHLERLHEFTYRDILKAKEIEKMSYIDPLTGCQNRMALNWAYKGEYGQHFSIGVISCDLNGLKKVNDQGGHEAGDRFIRDVADVLINTFGQPWVYRVGGDEFIVVLLSATKSEFNRKIQELYEGNQERGVSVSVGYIYTTDMGKSFEDLLRESDKKMYEEKRAYYKKRGIDRRNRSEMNRNAEFIDAMVDYGSSCYLACRINLTRNTYEIIHVMEGYDVSFRNTCHTLEELLAYPAQAGVVHKDDVDDYKKYVNTKFLSEYARNNKGQNDCWIRYRSKYDREEYHLIEIQFFFGREYSDEEQIGYALLKDMGLPFREGKLLFDEVLKALSQGFESIFYVNFETDGVLPYRISPELKNALKTVLPEKCKYEDAMKFFIENLVCDKDKEVMDRVCSSEYIYEQFKSRKSFTQDFRMHKNNNEVYYRIKFANMGNLKELKHLVLGFENINSEHMMDRDFVHKGEKILIVEDVELNREILRDMLGEKYVLLEAADGDEALKILEEHCREISLVLTDIVMPKCDGYELIERMKNDRRYCNIPIIVSTADGENTNRERCLSSGATEFVSKPYNKSIILNRVSSLIRLYGISATLSKIEVDSITGLYAKEAFFNYAQETIEENPDTTYMVVVSDIVGFKSINEQYGQEVGNSILKYIACAIKDSPYGCMIGGRLGSDIIACITPKIGYKKEQIDLFIDQLRENAPIPNLLIKFGMYCTADSPETLIQRMCDKAVIALQTIKGQYGVRYAVYDSEMGKKQQLEQNILKNMDIAIKEKQFKVYYQPKYAVKNKALAGAEALVRWINPEMGFMPPNSFLPLFEKNGFITKLDKYVWEEVCRDMAGWIDRGYNIPVSVNVSRRDFTDEGLADYIIGLTDTYGIPHNMFHIEVTESAYSDNPEMLKNTIKKLHDRGFIVELDDFGTGYSSITALTGMNIDILKLDLSIIQDKNDEEKNVLDFSMNLAKILDMQTVQEGVETDEQFQRVKDKGCTYVQGYLFSKPLPKDEFDRMLTENKS